MPMTEASDVSEYELMYHSESYGDHKRGVKIFIIRSPQTREAQARLDNDHAKWKGHLTPFENEKYWYDRVGKEVERLIDLQETRLDPRTEERILKTKADFEKCFTDAGLGPIFMEEIENRYWPKAYAGSRLSEPWYIVTTPIGYIEIGWRKRVINIDWTRTVLKSIAEDPYRDPERVVEGPELFPLIKKEGYPTLGETFIHAYGYEKATEYLKVLAEWKKRGRLPKAPAKDNDEP